MEPDGELAGDLEVGEGVAVFAGQVMGGAVAGSAQLVKEINDILRGCPFDLEAAEQVGLRLFGGGKEAGARGDLLGKLFAPLAQLDQGGAGVVAKVALGQGGELDKLFVVVGEKGEIGGVDLQVGPPLLRRESGKK
jgi:hypothetical protein